MVAISNILSGLANNYPNLWINKFVKCLERLHELRRWTDYVNEPIKWAIRHNLYLRDASAGQKDINPEDYLLRLHRQRNCFFSLSEKILSEIRAVVKKDFAGSSQRSIAGADLACDKTFKLLGVGPYHFNGEIDWSSDLKGNSWEKGKRAELNRKIYSAFPKNRYIIGDIKIPWELNKHLFFFDLARAYVITNDDKYAQEFCSYLDSWLRQNPVGMNLAWNEPLIVAQRAIAWVFAMRFFIHSPIVTGEFYLRFMASLYSHLEWIDSYYELCWHSSNHLFGNLAGVLIIVSAFPDFDIAANSEARALGILSSQLKKQVYPDGVQYEQSVSYQRYIMEFFYAIILAITYTGKKLPVDLMKTAEKMTEYLMHVIAPSGMANLISDADGAYVYKFDNNHINDYRPHLALGGVLFGRGDFRQQGRGQDEVVIWTLGPGVKVPAERAPEGGSRWFKNGGVIVLRSGWTADVSQMVFDCGNIGMGFVDDFPHGTHGHDDLLSYVLAFHGRQLIVDGGSGSYSGNLPMHDALRVSMGHNIISLSAPSKCYADAEGMDVESHSVTAGLWTFRKRARPVHPMFIGSRGLEYAFCAHDGYRRFADAPVHERSVFYLLPDTFVVFDRIYSSVPGNYYHKILVPFHFYPGTTIQYSQKTVKASFEGEQVVCAIAGTADKWGIKMRKGEYAPLRGWFAQDYGVCLPAPTLDYEGVVTLPFCLVTVLYCGVAQQNVEPIDIRFIDAADSKVKNAAIMVCSQDSRILIIFLPAGISLLPNNLQFCESQRIAVLRYISDRIENGWAISGDSIRKI